MILKSRDKSILDVSSPEIWQDDILHRVELVKFFTTVIGCRKEAITMCLNGGWRTVPTLQG